MNCNDPERCKFWSERIAKYDGDRGEVVALCLCKASQHHRNYTSAKDGCGAGEAGEPIDLRW